MKTIRREDGVSNIIEYSIVLPLCLVAVCFLLVVGYYLHQSALLESAVYRSAMVVQRIYSDPNALTLIDFGTEEEFVGYKTKTELKDAGKLERDPYRFFSANYRDSEITTAVAGTEETLGKIRTIVEQGTLSPVKAIYVGEAEPGYEKSGCVVKVTQSFKLPGIFKLVGLPEETEISVQARASKTSQTEFVRNSMMVEDLIETLTDRSDAVANVVKTVQNVFAKIGDFFTKTGGAE